MTKYNFSSVIDPLKKIRVPAAGQLPLFYSNFAGGATAYLNNQNQRFEDSKNKNPEANPVSGSDYNFAITNTGNSVSQWIWDGNQNKFAYKRFKDYMGKHTPLMQIDNQIGSGLIV